MKQKKHKEVNILLVAGAVCVLSLAVMIAALCHPKSETGEFTPPPFDAAAEVGTPAVPDGLGWQELDAKVFKVAVCGRIVPSGDTADVWLTNPEDNTVWLKLRVLDAEGDVIGETGLIRPGEYVRSVALDRVPKDGDKITLKIMTYQPDTYYSEGSVTLDTTVREK